MKDEQKHLIRGGYKIHLSSLIPDINGGEHFFIFGVFAIARLGIFIYGDRHFKTTTSENSLFSEADVL